MNSLRQIEKDPTGIDAKIGEYFYQDEDNDVYFDEQGARPALCDGCNLPQKVDSEGYFYCRNNCFGEHPLGRTLEE